MDWTNMSLVPQWSVISLNKELENNNFHLDLRLLVPWHEPPGELQSTIKFTAEMSE